MKGWSGCAATTATEPYAKARRKRQVWVEPLFAEAKDWHGLRRFRLRGLEKVNSEALLIAAGQNLKRLLSGRWGWGRRPFPAEPLASSCPHSSPYQCSRHDGAAPTCLSQLTPRDFSAPSLFQWAGTFLRLAALETAWPGSQLAAPPLSRKRQVRHHRASDKGE